MVNANHKRTATEPASDTRTSTRVKTASLKQQQASKCLLFLTWIPHVSQGKGEQTEANALKEVERLKKKLAQQKQNNQKLAEFIQGMSHFCSHRETCLTLLTQESHSDVDTADLSLESEEMDDEPSAMQFSTAVSTQISKPMLAMSTDR